METVELEYPGQLGVGYAGAGVKRVQEWLVLRGVYVLIDGLYGPATAAALKAFCGTEELDLAAWQKLTEPMVEFCEPFRNQEFVTEGGIPAIAVYKASRLADQGAREISSNRGPWVRLFMKGQEGKNFPWCAGFVSTCLRVAAESVGGGANEVPDTFSCDEIGLWAEQRGRLMRASSQLAKPGDIFLVHRSGNDWIHTGFVIQNMDDCIRTVEGNTSVEGSREGRHVLRRIRSKKRLHIVDMAS